VTGVGLYERILVPVEGKPTDEPLLRHVRELAAVHQAEVILLRVAHYHTRDERTHEVEDGEAALAWAAAQLEGGGFPVRRELGHGEPADAILRAAHEFDADLIAMAMHGHGWLPRLIFGSVAESVRHRASVPLLLVRGREADDEADGA
jgi:nucleotide-binding universal stress UspA family protein